MTSFLWLGDCGLRRLSIQHVSTVSWVTKRCIKACQGTIFKVVLRQSVRNAWKNVQISGHAVLWLRFEACISSEREMGLLLAGTATARWRAGVDGRLGTGGDRVHRQEACYRFCCLPTQCVRVWTVDWAPVVTVCTARKHVTDSAVCPHSVCVCMCVCVDLRTNSHYFRIQH